MHSANTDPKLTATEVALRSLIPAPPGIDRDRLMYEVTHQIDVFRSRVARTLTRTLEAEFIPA